MTTSRARSAPLVRAILVAACLAGCAGRARVSPASNPSATKPPPETSTVVVDGIRFGAHATRTHAGAPCTTYVSEGRARQGRPDLVVTVLWRGGIEDPPRDREAVVAFLRAALSDAGGPDLVAWSWREVGAGAFGRDDLVGLAAVPAQGHGGVPVPAGAIELFPLTRDELVIVEAHGVPRVATMLALAQHVHPLPRWIDRDRATVATVADHSDEAWIMMPGTFQAGITAFLDIAGHPTLIPKPRGATGGWQLEGTWRLRVTPEAADALADHLASVGTRLRTSIAMAPDPMAGATFVWVPDGLGPQLVHSAVARGRPAVVLLSFFAARARVGAELVDDGVVISLSTAQRDALVAALRNGENVTIEPPSPGMMSWSLEWAHDTLATRPSGR